jgi:RNA polymerase sigma factor (sigma-70 family)
MWALSDEELFLALRQGSQEALEELVHRYHGALFGYAYRQVRDYHLAQDLVQETFFRLCRFSAGVNSPGAIKTWLYKVITNLINDWGQSAYQRYEYPSAQEQRTSKMVPFSDLIEQKEECRQILTAIRYLDQPHRNVVFLRFYEDLSLEQIAEVLDIPVGTVKSRLHYGLKTLLKCLSDEGCVKKGVGESEQL